MLGNTNIHKKVVSGLGRECFQFMVRILLNLP